MADRLTLLNPLSDKFWLAPTVDVETLMLRARVYHFTSVRLITPGDYTKRQTDRIF